MYAIVKSHVERFCPGSEMIVAGSYRRGAETSGDIDILIFPPPSQPSDSISTLSSAEDSRSCSSTDFNSNSNNYGI